MQRRAVVLGAVALAMVVRTAGGQESTGGAEAAPAPDKSAYTLFNPTPRELWRPLSADRPDATESPYTVDAGAVQVELSFVEYAFQDERGGTRQFWSVAPVNLKLGLTNSIDVQLLINPFESAEGGGEPKDGGFGDMGLRLKINLFGNDEGVMALALLPFVSFPTGADGVSSDAVEGGIAVPFAMELPAGFSLGAQIQFEFFEAEDGGSETVLSQTVVLGHDLIGDLAGYIEYIGEVTLDGDDDYSPSLSGGLTYGLSPNSQLDFGMVIGLDDPETDDLRIFSGLTVRF